MPSTCLSRHVHELCIAPSEPVLGDTYVVLQAGPNRTAASCEHPIHHFCLMSPNAGGRPRRVGKNTLKFAMQKVEDPRLRRQCILYSHDELNMRAIIDEATVGKLSGAADMRKVEHFDLRKNSMLLHLRCKSLNKARRVFVDDCREVHRASGQ